MIKLIIFFSIFSSIVSAASSIEAGKKIVMEGNDRGALACMTCHMQNGEGMQESGFPHLAGLHVGYISKQLKDLQSKKRINDVMNPIAKGLTEEDIANVAAYYSGLPIVSKVEKSTSSSFLLTGKLIAERGIWSKGVPACYACHGPNAVGVGEVFPPLINQGKIYLTSQLFAWKKGTRKNDPAFLMSTIAKKLTRLEIEAVSAYLSTLADTKTAEVR